ncbi:MAG TPA: MerR family transcriptional regulator [Polyangiaceae bacterium]
MTAAPAARRTAADRTDPWPYKMRDLCRLTGMPRQAVHFYIQQGLVPPGHKTGRNSARYGDAHVERIRVVRQLQNERFLPLRAIRAVLGDHRKPEPPDIASHALDGEDDAFTPEQRALLVDVKHRLASSLAPPAGSAALVDAKALLERHGLARADLDDLVKARLVAVVKGPRGRLQVAAEDEWAFELCAEVRRAGFTRDLGFDGRFLRLYERAVTALFEEETAFLTERLTRLPPDRVAAMLETAMPILDRFFARYHEKKVRDFFATMGD